MDIHSVRRYDFNGQITSIEKTPQGFLKVPGYATRTGVFPYLDPRGKMRFELRHPDDVFAPESLATLANAPVTLEHPPSMVTPDNYSQYSKGYTTDRVDVMNGMVECDIIIADADTVNAVENAGLRELSSGYTADIEEETGVYMGKNYDFRQTNIKYNHIAIVKQGRAGPEVRLRMDSADAVQTQDNGPYDDIFKKRRDAPNQAIVAEGPTAPAANPMAPGPVTGSVNLIRELLDAILDRQGSMNQTMQTVEDSMANRKDNDIGQKGISPQVDVVQSIPDGRSAGTKVVVATTQKNDTDPTGFMAGKDKKKTDDDGDATQPDSSADPASMDPKELYKTVVHLKALMEAMQAKMDELSDSAGSPSSDSDVDDDADAKTTVVKQDSINAQVSERVALYDLGRKVLPKTISARFDSMTNNAIRCAVIKARHPHASLEGKSSIYVQSRFDSIAEAFDEGEAKRREIGAHLVNERNDSGQAHSPEAARSRMIQASRDQYKTPLSSALKK